MADKKLIAVMGGGLVVGVGAFAAYLIFGATAVSKSRARPPIQAWLARWEHTRACFLGDPPAAADPADALTVRALADEPGACGPLVAGLGRPEGEASGVDEIEAAWDAVEAASRALAQAPREPAKKGPAIAALDAAAAKLRAAAGIDARPPPGKPRVAIAPLTLGPALAGTAGASIGRLDTRGHALVGELTSGHDVAQLIVRGPRPGDVTIARRAPDTVRALPGGAWGAVIERDDASGAAQVTAGPVGDSGEVGDGGVVVVKGAVDEVLGAVGAGKDRALVLRLGGDVPSVAIARSADGGARWSAPQVLIKEADSGTVVAAADPVTGAFDLFWVEPDLTAMTLHLADPPAAAKPRPMAMLVPSASPEQLCLAGPAWYLSAGGNALLLRSDRDDAVTTPGEIEAAQLRACTAAAVVVATGPRFFRCDTKCDAGLLLPTPADLGLDGVVDLFDGAGLVYAQQLGDVVAVWRTGVEPRFFRVPASAALVGVAVWGKDQTLALADKAGLHLAVIAP